MDFGKGILVHLCTARSWSLVRQRGVLRPEPTIGFIHLSTPEQVHLPANRLYRGRRELVLLSVDPGRIRSPLRWEPGTDADAQAMLFPHLYGPLPASAVVDVTDYSCGPDGTFPAVNRTADSAGPR